MDTISTESFSPIHSTSTTVLNTPPDDITPSSVNLMHDNTKNTSISTLISEQQIDETADNLLKEDQDEQTLKTNGALIKSILADFEKNREDDAASLKITTSDNHGEEPSTPTRDIESIIEENYMTMTPKKNILEPPPSESNESIRLVDTEENHYVEMTQGTDVSLLNPNNNATNYEQQPYEVVCFNSGKMEPVYMELRPNILVGDKTKLPDILMLAQSNKCKTNKSDSSDADDEASKDLDSLDTPSHPRFSLSDTFRPASYYLGATQTAPELQDSSDSELVSPPPIPRSPPPLDELDESSNQDFSLTENFKKSEPEKSQNFYSGDTSSVCSINTDTERRFGSRLSHNSDSDVELRQPISRSSDYERMLKRRPVSEEFYDELDSLDMHFNEVNENIDLDKYLKDLQMSNISTADTTFHDYENLRILSQNSEMENVSLLGNLSSIAPSHSRDRCSRDTTHSHSRQNSRDTVNTQDSSNRSLLSPDCVHRRAESSASISTDLHGFLHSSRHSTPSIRPESSVSNREISNTSSYFYDPKKSQLAAQTAPYYYSDLSMNTSHSDSTSTILTLNNQRSAMIGSKRDITHIVNPIRCTGRSSRNSGRNSRQNLIDNTFKLAAEARSVSVDFLNLTDKSGQIDKKNIYESDTLKRLKAMDSITSLQSNPETRNLFPSRTSEKFSDVGGGVLDASVRRSHSLEGLLENVLIEAGDSMSAQDSNIVENESDRTVNVITEGSYLWEEDSIWQERLRTASQRHTKSLDDLDCIGESKRHRKQPRGIIRGVTYVNDNIYNMPLQNKYHHKDSKKNSEVKTKDSNFTIDREKLRQWDLMSSAPNIQDTNLGVRVNMVVDMGDEVIGIHSPDQSNTQEQGTILHRL